MTQRIQNYINRFRTMSTQNIVADVAASALMNEFKALTDKDGIQAVFTADEFEDGTPPVPGSFPGMGGKTDLTEAEFMAGVSAYDATLGYLDGSQTFRQAAPAITDIQAALTAIAANDSATATTKLQAALTLLQGAGYNFTPDIYKMRNN